ncbi:MAG: hypothetical protein AAFP79_05470 [Pseudomonadota bacterium]
MKPSTTTALAASLAAAAFALPVQAHAQSDPSASSEVMHWDDDAEVGKFAFSLAIVAANYEVNLENSQVVLPESFDFGDFDVTLDEDVNFTSLFTGASVSYRVLPFLSLDARAGYVSAESDFGVTVAGTPGDQFPGLIQGPIALTSEVSTNVEGVNAGIGAKVIVPVFSVGSKKVLMYGTYEHSWSEYDDDNFSANYGRVASGFVFPFSLEDRLKPVFRLGASYTNVERSFERSFSLNGETALVSADQGTDHPVSIEFGAIIPVSRKFYVSIGSSVQTTGNASFLASLTFTP